MNIAREVVVSDNERWTPVVSTVSRAYYVYAQQPRTDMRATPVKRSAIAPAETADYEYVSYPTLYPVSGEGYTFTTAPVYTYPQEWTSDDNGEPYFKISMPWLSNKRGSSNIYYKVTVPKPTDGTWTIGRNKWYQVVLDLSIVDTENEYVEVDFGYTVHDWAESTWVGGSGMSSARFFDVPVREFTLYSDETLAIPYSSSSAVTAYFTGDQLLVLRFDQRNALSFPLRPGLKGAPRSPLSRRTRIPTASPWTSRITPAFPSKLQDFERVQTRTRRQVRELHAQP